MNNKGMTLVELLITFSLMMIIIVGIFNVILDVRLDLDNKRIIKDVTEYSNFVNHDIQYDMIMKRPFAIAWKETAESNWDCTYGLYGTDFFIEQDCAIGDDNKFAVQIVLTNKIAEQTVSGEFELNDRTNKEVCGGMFPCAVYAYYDRNKSTNSNLAQTIPADFEVIAIDKDNASGKGYGIKHGSVFEPIPYQDRINKKKMVNARILADDNNIIVELPIYLSGEEQNYGFMSVYPFKEVYQ